MESEERPAKMRKLEHAEEEAIGGDAVAGSSNIETNDAHPVTTENGGEVTMADSEPAATKEPENEAPKISKNQLKKQRRHEQWEAGRDDRKLKRKEKIKERKERRKEVIKEAIAKGEAIPPPIERAPRHSAGLGKQVPIAVIFDCDFEELMFDNELKSLGLQITRCYSDNRKANFRAHLALTSFGGKMKERFDGILAAQYKNWKGFRFFEEDFVDVAEKAKEWMAGPQGGEIAGALKQAKAGEAEDTETGQDPSEEEGEIVYLSSESDNVLTHLKPNSTYIIGGLVDKNRHKGICHKRAVNRNIKTAKLPISEFLEMNSRQVLVTNHVLEIMLKWMEYDDWGKAFMAVMPKRKGGKLRGEAQDDDDEADEAQDVDETTNGQDEVETAGSAAEEHAPTESAQADKPNIEVPASI